MLKVKQSFVGVMENSFKKLNFSYAIWSRCNHSDVFRKIGVEALLSSFLPKALSQNYFLTNLLRFWLIYHSFVKFAGRLFSRTLFNGHFCSNFLSFSISKLFYYNFWSILLFSVSFYCQQVEFRKLLMSTDFLS